MNEMEVLKEFHNNVGHALIDYYLLEGLDSVDKRQIQARAMEKIQLASDRCDKLLTSIRETKKRTSK